MHYSRTSWMVVRNRRALLLAAALSFFSSMAQADVMQDCALKEKNVQDFNDCVVAAEQRSMRELRTLSLSLTKNFQSKDDKRAYRSYAKGESRLVRERKRRCGTEAKNAVKQQMDPEQARLACLADFNFSHLEELKKRYPE